MKPIIDEKTQSLIKTANDKIQFSPPEITSDEILKKTHEFSVSLAKMAKEISARRLDITKPIRDEVDKINKQIMPIEKALDKKSKEMIQKAFFYQEQQRKLQEQKQSSDLLSAADALLSGDEVSLTESIQPQTTVKSQEYWTFDVVDISQVPAEYLVINESKVMQAIQTGTDKIAGLKIYKAKRAVRR